MLTTHKPPFVDLDCALVPMQFSDTRKQKRKDANKIFKKLGADVICGTEAGEEPLRSILQKAAEKHGYRFFIRRGHWIAVKLSIISPRGWSAGYAPVLEHYQGIGKHSDRGVAWVQFDHILTGDQITIGAGHYLTKGGNPGSPNWNLNERYGKAIGRLAREKARGHGLFIYMGDQNTRDRVYDTFHGEELTSVWDELKKWPDTGHGNIDVIATYNKDRRVKVKKAWVEDDEDFFLRTDHFVTRAVLRIQQRSKLKLS